MLEFARACKSSDRPLLLQVQRLWGEAHNGNEKKSKRVAA